MTCHDEYLPAILLLLYSKKPSWDLSTEEQQNTGQQGEQALASEQCARVALTN